VNKVLILKNDRTGDLFTSLKTINLIFNKHKNNIIEIFLSKVNYKFRFLFRNKKIKILNINLDLFDKLKLINYFLFNNIETVYILTPKNFYFYLPLIFFYKKIKFYGICIDARNKRPNNFLRKFLFKKVIINRIDIKKRRSTYEMQQDLIEQNSNVSNLIDYNQVSNLKIEIPKNSVFFHYKDKMFRNLLKWDFDNVKNFLEYLASKKEYIIFSSELNNIDSDKFFSENFNSYDFLINKSKIINKKKILFLKNIDGLDLYTAIKHSSEIIAPEGIITHIGYSHNKKILSMMHFNLKNKQDFINQIISCKEWFPPNNFNFIVLKKDYGKTLKKIDKRI
tara:strand:- start:1760 stop:2770 length:1011 start_codon:yes stop_codon:yes gene_type:complete